MDDATTRRTALIASTLASFATPFMVSSANIALRSIDQQFGMSAVSLSWVSTIYTLAAAVFLVPFGKLADIWGRKLIFAWGLAVYSLASLLCALADSATMLLVFRALQGIGAAMIFGTGVAILTSVYPSGERGRVLGINTAAVYAGLSTGPFLGGLMVAGWGWRSVFAVNVPLGLIALLFTVWKLRGEWRDAEGETFDLVGSGIYGLSVIAVMYGLSRLPGWGGLQLILVGFVAGLAFVHYEARQSQPVLDLKLFRGHRTFVLSSLAALINYSATSAVTFLLSLYLQYIKGLPPQQAGTILVAQPIVMAVLSPLAGRLSDRIETRIVASAGMAITVVGLVMLWMLGETSSLGYVIACLMVLGLGFALFSSPNTSAIMGAVERRFYGVASGLMGTMRLFGQMLSMGIVMLLFALYMGRVQITPEYYLSFLRSAKTSFGIAAILCFIGLFASLARGNALKPQA